MRARKLLMFVGLAGLGFGIMAGCGGGGGDGNPPSPPPPKSNLKVADVNAFASDISNQAGCEYTEVASSQNPYSSIALSLDNIKIIKKVIADEKSARKLSGSKVASAAPMVASTEPGSCGGTLTMPDDIESSGNYIFDNYCMSDPDTGSQTKINGTLSVTGDQATNTITASTPTPLRIVSENPNTNEKVDGTIDLDNGKLVMNDDESIDITVSALTVTDHVANKTHKITNLTVAISEGVVTFKVTYTGSETAGVITSSGSVDIATGEGVITAADESGNTVKFNSTSTEGIYDVNFNSSLLGKMDCTAANIPEI